jgi:hypothetical protein
MCGQALGDDGSRGDREVVPHPVTWIGARPNQPVVVRTA